MAAKIKKNDTVVVTVGRDKGKQGKVLKILPDKGKALIEGVNLVWKHKPKTQENPQGQRVQENRPYELSNVMLVDPETGKPTRVRFEMRDGVKHRVAVKSGADLGRV